MRSFASVYDLEDRWRPMSPEEAAKAEVLPGDASSILQAEMDKKGVSAPTECEDSALAANLRSVACAMVRRAMVAGEDALPYTQTSETVGPFSQSFTVPGNTGELYVTTSELKRLGLKRGRAFTVNPEIRGFYNAWR